MGLFCWGEYYCEEGNDCDVDDVVVWFSSGIWNVVFM